MNYEFHVGDYVETVGGFVGWISDIKDNNYIVIVDKNNTRGGYYLPQEDRYFVRIGAYDFTKKEKKTIKKLNLQGYLSTQAVASVVNELVDAVNRLEKL